MDDRGMRSTTVSDFEKYIKLDITDADAKNGDVIELLNDKITLDDWAEILQTINYELMCRLKVRLARVYTR